MKVRVNTSNEPMFWSSKTAEQATISIRWCWKEDKLYADIIAEALAVAERTASLSTRAITHYSFNKVIASHLRKSTLSFCV